MADKSDDKVDKVAKSLDELLKQFDKTNKAQERYANSITKLSENLSNAGVDKLMKEVKDATKQLGIMTDEQLSSIKTIRQLEDAISHLEDKYDDIEKAEKAREKRIAKAAGLDEKAKARAIKLAEQEYDVAVARLNLTKAQSEAIYKNINALNAQTNAAGKEIAKRDVLNKTLEKHTDKLKDSIKNFFTLDFGLKLAASGLKDMYDEMTLFTQRGLLGAYADIQLMSVKFRMSAKETQELINRNRDLINVLGGGLKGLNSFGNEVVKAREGLDYLGKHSTAAAVKFMESQKKFGLTAKDGVAYTKSLNNMKKSYKDMAGMFGDSYEEYSNLIDLQASDENYKRKLNGMSKEQLSVAQQELMIRTNNYKLMGLSNEQIVDFNKTLEDINNPNKNDIGERAKEGVMGQNSFIELKRLMETTGNSKEANDLAESMGTMKELSRAYMSKDTEAQKRIMTGSAGQKMNLAFAAANAKANSIGSGGGTGQSKVFSFNRLKEESGVFGNLMTKGSDFFGDANRQGKNNYTAGNDKQAAIARANGTADVLTPEQQAASDDLLGKTSKLASAFETAAIAVEGFKSITENSLIKTITGIGITLLAFRGIFSTLTSVLSKGLPFLSRMFPAIAKMIPSFLSGGAAAAEAATATTAATAATTSATAGTVAGTTALTAAATAAAALATAAVAGYVAYNLVKDDDGRSGERQVHMNKLKELQQELADAKEEQRLGVSDQKKVDAVQAKINAVRKEMTDMKNKPSEREKIELKQNQEELEKIKKELAGAESLISTGMADMKKIETLKAKIAEINSVITKQQATIASKTPAAPIAGNASKVTAATGDAASRKVVLENELTKQGIVDPAYRAAIMGQMHTETGGFKQMRELGSKNMPAGQQYEGRAKGLGNTEVGDGQKYKGRGYIQLTGRANYTHYGKKLGLDLVNQPELAEQPDIAAKIAVAYAKDHNLEGKFKTGGVDAVTKSINGGMNGAQQRRDATAMYTQQYAKSGIGVQQPTTYTSNAQTPLKPPVLAENTTTTEANGSSKTDPVLTENQKQTAALITIAGYLKPGLGKVTQNQSPIQTVVNKVPA